MSTITMHDTPELFAYYEGALAAQGFQSSTIYQRIRLLKQLGADPRTATRADVLRVLDAAHKASTRRVYLNSLRIAYHDLRQLGLVDVDPTEGLRTSAPPRARPRPMNEREVTALLSLPGRERSWSVLGLRAGLRAAEVCRVKPTDLQWTDRGWVLHVIGKGGTDCVVPAHPDVVALLEPLAGYDRPLWPMRPCHMSTRWRAAAESVGVHGHRFHDCRHTYATQLFSQTGDLYTVQQLMRHASIQTTTIYAKPDESRQFDAVAGL